MKLGRMDWRKRMEKSNKKRKKRLSRKLYCVVHFLDKTTHTFRLAGEEKGDNLLSYACHYASILEPKYFGLKFYNSKSCQGYQWLETDKLLCHQLKSSKGEFHFYFKVKYYVENPSQLIEDQTRHLFFLQIWSDVVAGILPASVRTTCLLTSYFLQTLIGDFQSEEEDKAHLTKLDPMPTIAKENCTMIIELHKLLRGQSMDYAQSNFLDYVKRIELYGVDLHLAKDSNEKPIQLGVSSRSIDIYSRSTRVNSFSWCKIVKVFYKNNRFFMQLLRGKLEDYDTVVGFCLPNRHAAKLLWKTCIEQHSFFRLGHTPNPSRVNKGIFPFLRRLLTPNTCYILTTQCTLPSCQRNERWMNATYRRYDNLHKVQTLIIQPPRQAWSSAPDISLPSNTDETKSDEKEPLSTTASISPSTAAFVPLDIYQGISFADDDIDDTRLPLYLEPEYQSGFQDEFHVELTADSSGRFGFNMRFQSSGLPVYLSRIIPNSPADNCYPRLLVGDELVAVNNIFVHQLSHKEIVDMFQAAKISKLILRLRRSRLYDWNEQDQLPYEHIVEASEITAEQSIMNICHSLRSGTLVSSFELLQRSRPELACSIAKTPENVKKNRYGDIFPYDCNRVTLKSSMQGDYINASYINIPLPGTNNVMRYIATQGPLPHTVEDFWCLVWDYNIQIIAMVTPELERGIPKCHRYWPDMGDTVSDGNFILHCNFQNHLGGYLHREFLLTRNGETRSISHIQYVDWPDHGVPGSTSPFLDYVRYVRYLNGKKDHYILVHCSAGIGRTGSFILLDTALKLLQTGHAVHPLRIVKTMRDQRPMMVQTAMQFSYVCECVINS